MKIAGVIVFVVVLQCCGFHAAFGQGKVVTIDTEKIINGYYKVKDAQKRFDDARAAVAKEYQDRLEGYQRISDVIKKLSEDIQNAGSNTELKEGKARILGQDVVEQKRIQDEMVALRTTREGQIEEQFTAARAALMGDVTKAVETQVKNSHYDIVLDKSAMGQNGLPMVVYSRDGYDLSASVIEALNKSKPPEAADASPSPGVAGAASSPSASPSPGEKRTHKKHKKDDDQ